MASFAALDPCWHIFAEIAYIEGIFHATTLLIMSFGSNCKHADMCVVRFSLGDRPPLCPFPTGLGPLQQASHQLTHPPRKVSHKLHIPRFYFIQRSPTCWTLKLQEFRAHSPLKRPLFTKYNFSYWILVWDISS